MAAILDPVLPDTDEPRAEAFESAIESNVVPRDSIPLESMTWPELKRVAREYDLKLNVKKPVLIQQIREARTSLAEDSTRRQTFRGRMEIAADEARQRFELARDSLANWWKHESPERVEDASAASDVDGTSRIKKIAIWCGGILAGGVVATIAALI